MKWIKFGFDAIDDYMKCKGKIPVFPIDWLLMQNFEKIKEIRFDKNNQKKVKKI